MDVFLYTCQTEKCITEQRLNIIYNIKGIKPTCVFQYTRWIHAFFSPPYIHIYRIGTPNTISTHNDESNNVVTYLHHRKNIRSQGGGKEIMCVGYMWQHTTKYL